MWSLVTSPITFSVLGYRTLSKWLYTRIRDPFVQIRTLSTYHAAVTTLLSMVYLGGYLSDSVYGWFLTLLSSGFFILDLAHIILFRNHYTRSAIGSYAVHHVACLVATRYHPQYSWDIARGYLSEASTPFLNLSWKWRRENRMGIPYFSNAALILALFWNLRIVNFTVLLYTRWNDTCGVYRMIIFSILILNIGWSVKLIESFRKDYRTWTQAKRIHD